jgi:hypothetical protein
MRTNSSCTAPEHGAGAAGQHDRLGDDLHPDLIGRRLVTEHGRQLAERRVGPTKLELHPIPCTHGNIDNCASVNASFTGDGMSNRGVDPEPVFRARNDGSPPLSNSVRL